MIDRAKTLNWAIHMLGHDEQLQFLQKYYPKTSLLWAYQTIHPEAGASAGDIWRYAVLYALGLSTHLLVRLL